MECFFTAKSTFVGNDSKMLAMLQALERYIQAAAFDYFGGAETEMLIRHIAYLRICTAKIVEQYIDIKLLLPTVLVNTTENMNHGKYSAENM